jgi:hypothetical protein
MSEALDLLKTNLSRVLRDSWQHAGPWADSGPMERTLVRIRKIHDSPVSALNQNRVAAAVAVFRRTKRIPDPASIRYICYGVGDIREGWCVLCEPELREILRSYIEASSRRLQLRCFQSLLRSYFGFPRDAEQTPVTANEGWVELRGWLRTGFDTLQVDLAQDDEMRRPAWFKTLADHANLLTEHPCDVYGRGLLEGDTSALQEAKDGLAIRQDSWVFEEAVLAQVHHVVGLKDLFFQESIDRILAIVFRNSEFNVSKGLARRCVALLVSRYARCSSRHQNMALRDATLESIGNPWLRRQAWDAYVVDEHHRPDNEARELILSWLRQQLIKDFFELLSEDRAADPRRLNYWLRFEPVIQDMWFVLGSQAAASNHPDYVEFRKRARGRVRRLSGQTQPNNNAFVMRIGGHVAVEFGITNYACRLGSWDQLPERVVSKLNSGSDNQEIEIELFRDGAEQLKHIDSPRAGRSWEQKFDDRILPKVIYQPSRAASPLSRSRLANVPGPLTINGTNQSSKVEYDPTHLLKRESKQLSSPSSAVRTVRTGAKASDRDEHQSTSHPKSDSNRVATSSSSVGDIAGALGKHRYPVQDNRQKGGAYWVFVENGDFEFARKLRDLGFRYKPEKGWWKE